MCPCNTNACQFSELIGSTSDGLICHTFVADSELWDEDEEDIEPQQSMSNLFPAIQSRAVSLVRWIVAFLSFMQGIYHLSDSVIAMWTTFLSTPFVILASFSSLCRDISQAFPKSLHMLRKMNGCLNLNFVRYVVCRKCHAIYHMNKCVRFNEKRCPFVAYPSHPHRRMRQSCDTLLLKSVELASGKYIISIHDLLLHGFGVIFV